MSSAELQMQQFADQAKVTSVIMDNICTFLSGTNVAPKTLNPNQGSSDFNKLYEQNLLSYPNADEQNKGYICLLTALQLYMNYFKGFEQMSQLLLEKFSFSDISKIDSALLISILQLPELPMSWTSVYDENITTNNLVTEGTTEDTAEGTTEVATENLDELCVGKTIETRETSEFRTTTNNASTVNNTKELSAAIDESEFPSIEKYSRETRNTHKKSKAHTEHEASGSTNLTSLSSAATSLVIPAVSYKDVVQSAQNAQSTQSTHGAQNDHETQHEVKKLTKSNDGYKTSKIDIGDGVCVNVVTVTNAKQMLSMTPGMLVYYTGSNIPKLALTTGNTSWPSVPLKCRIYDDADCNKYVIYNQVAARKHDARRESTEIREEDSRDARDAREGKDEYPHHEQYYIDEVCAKLTGLREDSYRNFRVPNKSKVGGKWCGYGVYGCSKFGDSETLYEQLTKIEPNAARDLHQYNLWMLVVALAHHQKN